MAQLAPVAALVGTGASVLATVRQAQQQQAAAKAQSTQLQAQAQAQAEVAAAQATSASRSRAEALERTVASARARAGASGIGADNGSAAAVTAGLRRDAASDLEEDELLRNARLASGRRSLLNADGSLTTWLRAGSSLAGATRSLLD